MKTKLCFLVLVCTSVMLILACKPDKENREELNTGIVEPNEAKGGDYPAVIPDLKKDLDEKDEPYIVPDGPIRGDLKPTNEKTEIKEGGDGEAVSFQDYNELDDAGPMGHFSVPEPSVAENGETVMHAGNFWMSLSLDGGATFNSVNPTNIFPETYGGFCCDQVLTYVPEFDMFVWLLQYTQDGSGTNAIRIAIQNTPQVRSSNGTSWTYWDFKNTDMASSGRLDRNDMSFGGKYLYWSTSIGGGGNRYAVRVPLNELNAKSTVNYQYTNSTDAQFSHVTQNGSNGVYWAGHDNNSTMIVYSMMDNDNSYSWRDVAVNSWPNGTMSSTAADGNNWMMDGARKNYIRAAAVDRENIYFAWNASDNGNFPQTHVQIVEIDKSSFTLSKQMQIWNPDFAFAYPYFDINNQNKLGIITGFGGDIYNASSGIGVWGDFVIYYPRLSSASQTNYGHYHTVRRSGTNFNEWVASGYTYEADGSILPYYVRYNH